MNNPPRPQPPYSDRHRDGPAGAAPRMDAEVRTGAEVFRDVDDMLDALARLTASDVLPAQFQEQLLAQGLQQAGALAGAIWLAHDGVVQLVQWRGDDAIPGELRDSAARRRLVQRVVDVRVSQSEIIEPTRAGQDRSLPRYISVAAPFFVDHPAAGAIELLLPAAAGPEAQSQAVDLVEALAELMGDYHRRQQIEQYRKSALQWTRAQQFIERVYRSGLHETAVALANEGRWFTGCDRASLLCRESYGCSVLAVSGVDRIEPRSNLMRRLEDLGAAVLQTNEALWEAGESTARPPQIETLLQDYYEESHARTFAALPLQMEQSDNSDNKHGEDAAFGVLVLEWFSASTLGELAKERIELVTRHGARALANALVTERLPFIRVNRALAKIRWLTEARQRRAMLWALCVVAVLVIGLMFVPADFEVAAEGELQPAERREIFAPADGVIDAVLVEHGDDVSAGTPLLRLRSPSLDFENARLLGEIQTAQQRLDALRTARLDIGGRGSVSADRSLQLTADEEELKETLKSLRRQEQLIAQQRGELEVRSPLAGRVLTWDVARQLTARPVQRGQSLLSVGNVAGRWVTELRVPDRQIGYVMSALDQARPAGQEVTVSFLMNSDPSIACHGVIQRIALRSQIDDYRGEPVVLVTVHVDEAPEGSRPGGGVIGKIDCGRRSIGFIWLHDAWNSIRRRALY